MKKIFLFLVLCSSMLYGQKKVTIRDLDYDLYKQLKNNTLVYSDISEALTQVGSDSAFLEVTTRVNFTQSARDTLPATAQLIVKNGGRIVVGNKLTVSGSFADPGAVTVFEGNIDSVEFVPGSVDYVRPEWFGAMRNDGVDDVAAFRAAVNVVESSSLGENQPILVVGDGIWHFSDSLKISSHGIRFSGNSIIRPIGSYTGYLITIDGDRANRDSLFSENNKWLAKIDLKGLTIDGNRQSKGIRVNRLDHFQISNVHVTRTVGTAFRMELCREGSVYDLNVTMCDAASDSGVVMIYEDSGGDQNNNIRFYSPSIIYNAGRALYISTGVVGGKPRNIYIFGAQVHYLDSGLSPFYFSPVDSLVPLIDIPKGEKISFFGGNFRMGNYSTGVVFKLGSSGNLVRYIDFHGGVLSGEASTLIGFDFVNATEIGIFGLNNTMSGASAKLASDMDAITAALYESTYMKTSYNVAQGKAAIYIGNTIDPTDTETGKINFVEPTSSKARSLKANQTSLVFDITAGDDRVKSWNFNADDSSFYMSTGDSLMNIGLQNRRLRSVGFYPKASQPPGYQGMVAGSDGSWGGYGDGLYYHDGSNWLPIVAMPSGSDSFSGIALTDTVTVPMGTVNSVYLISVKDKTPVADDLLGWEALSGNLVVHRNAGTTADLAYSWVLVKK